LQFAGLVDEEQNRSVLELRLQLIGFLVTEAESAEDLAQLVSRFVVPVGDEVVEIADVGADTLTDEAVGALLVVSEQMQGLLRHALRRQPVQSVEHADVVLEGLHGRLLGLSVHDLPPLRVDVSSPTGSRHASRRRPVPKPLLSSAGDYVPKRRLCDQHMWDGSVRPSDFLWMDVIQLVQV